MRIATFLFFILLLKFKNSTGKVPGESWLISDFNETVGWREG